MPPFTPYSLNLCGQLYTINRPQVMGIINLTPDSFYAESRTPAAAHTAIATRAAQLVAEGADFIDVGAYSSRPGATDVSTHEELARLRAGIAAIRAGAPTIPLSVDTFRAEVAQACIEELGVAIINDIAGGTLDPNMYATVARLGVPYVLMHLQGTPQTMQQAPHYTDVAADVLRHLAQRVDELHQLGVADIIVDPGFGFGKTLAHNYTLLRHLAELHQLHCPVLVGISRKSMIYQPLGTTPQEALNGSTVLHTLALERGAHFLRVHDVRPAVEAVCLWQHTHSLTS
ncbi:MAG: dihydropteroate synthase [Bacteroidales bacterium]|nr:dihydropteroate synthase [Bacteroidales bacterium]